MGKRSTSKTSSSTENVQNISNRNLALSDFEGIGIGEADRTASERNGEDSDKANRRNRQSAIFNGPTTDCKRRLVCWQ